MTSEAKIFFMFLIHSEHPISISQTFWGRKEKAREFLNQLKYCKINVLTSWSIKRLN